MINHGDTVSLENFDKFYRLSLVYLSFDPQGSLRLQNELVRKNKSNFIL